MSAGTDELDEASDPYADIEDLALPIPLATIVPLSIALAATMAWTFGADRVLVAVVPFVVLLAAITVIDLRELRVPNRLLKPGYALAVVLLPIASTSSWPDVSLGRAVLGGLVLGGIYFLICLVYPVGMGFGDVKLAPLLGAVVALFGWIPLGRAVIIAHLVGGVAAIAILAARVVMRGRLRKIAFPFAPFMATGAVVALILEAG